MNNLSAFHKALHTSPIELLYRWNKYQEERKTLSEGFDGNFGNVPPPKDVNNSSEAKWLFGLTGWR